jgi:hypothetical protein
VARSGKTLGEIIGLQRPAYERVMQPFLLAALNIDPREGERPCPRGGARNHRGGRPCVPALSRAAGPERAFVEPALEFCAAMAAR